VQETSALIRTIASREPGTRVLLQVVRDGRAQDVDVVLVERPCATPRAARRRLRRPPGGGCDRGIGISVQELTRLIRTRWKLPAALSGIM